MEQIKIFVNGSEKLATGLTKETTVDDIKFAMLYSSVPKFKAQMLNDYGLFEQWQSNERLLDSNVKIYKIVKLWKQIPGDQLSQVKFVIKQKCSSKSNENKKMSKEFKYCSLSPSVQKTWNFLKEKNTCGEAKVCSNHQINKNNVNQCQAHVTGCLGPFIAASLLQFIVGLLRVLLQFIMSFFF